MICYFWEKLKPFIKVEIEQQNRESENFERIMKRAVTAEDKVGRKSSAIVRDLNTHYPKGHCSSYTILIKVHTQGFNTKESKPKESRPKKSKLAKIKTSAPPRSKYIEPGKSSCIDKKREYLKKKKDQKNNTPATGNNVNAGERSEKKQNDQSDKRCYKCQKKGHFSKNCLEPPKN